MIRIDLFVPKARRIFHQISFPSILIFDKIMIPMAWGGGGGW